MKTRLRDPQEQRTASFVSFPTKQAFQIPFLDDTSSFVFQKHNVFRTNTQQPFI